MACQKRGAVLSILEKYVNPPNSLISILQDIQAEFKYLPKDILELLSKETRIKLAKIYGVATFYKQFRLTPSGDNIIMLCQGTACHVNGSKRLEGAIKNALRLSDSDTTADGRFSLENVACLGCCSLSPVMTIGDRAYGNLDPASAVKILENFDEGGTEA